MCEFYACRLSPLISFVCVLIEEEEKNHEMYNATYEHETRVNNKNRNLCEY